MKQIKGIETIRSLFQDWEPSGLAFIRKIELFFDKGHLMIEFLYQKRTRDKGWPGSSEPFHPVVIYFENVSKFHLNAPGNGLHRLMGFDIEDISGNDWEGINFHISDYEDGSIEFYCKEVEIAIPGSF